MEREETERVQPLISVKWGQRSPYNNAAPLIEGQRAHHRLCSYCNSSSNGIS